MEIREVNEKEFLKVHDFVKNCQPLEVYPVHLYRILFRYFKNICFLAEEGRQIFGFASGLVTQVSPQTCFFWQVGVSLKARGKGLGKKLTSCLEERAKKLGCQRIELTVDLENIPSQKLFDKLNYKNISDREKDIVKEKGKIAAKDYYGPGRHFIIYEKNL